MTNYQSFTNLKKIWLKQLQDFGHEKIHIVLVGNKKELAGEDDNEVKREVSVEEAVAFAKEHNIDFVETSALTNSNVECVFRRAILSVAPVIPDVNTHLELTNLPKGWIKVVPDSASVSSQSESASLLKRANEKEKTDAAVESYCNYWTGEITETLPTEPAKTGLIHEVKNAIVQSYKPTASFCARTASPKGGGQNLNDFGANANDDDEEDGLRRLSTTSTGGIQLDMVRGKCYNCNIL